MEAITRLRAYRDAGADCLFPIGAQDAAIIEVLVRELAHPINILARLGSPSVGELEAMGVVRISLGGGPQRTARTRPWRAYSPTASSTSW